MTSIIDQLQNFPFGQELIDAGLTKTTNPTVFFKLVPKIGSSSLTYLLLELMYPRITEIAPEKFNPHQHSSKHYWLHNCHGPLLSSPITEDTLQHSTIFTFCRNPYTRLLSYYTNKFNTFLDDGELEYIKMLRRESVFLAANSARYSYETTFDPIRGISFDTFARYVCHSHTHSDIHWRPQIFYTAANIIPYTKIIRAENLTEELNLILKEYCQVEVPSPPKLNTSEPYQLSEFYTEELAEIVYEFYREDFSFFGYHKDSWRQ